MLASNPIGNKYVSDYILSLYYNIILNSMTKQLNLLSVLHMNLRGRVVQAWV